LVDLLLLNLRIAVICALPSLSQLAVAILGIGFCPTSRRQQGTPHFLSLQLIVPECTPLSRFYQKLPSILTIMIAIDASPVPSQIEDLLRKILGLFTPFPHVTKSSTSRGWDGAIPKTPFIA
jgi:hypothetical protein